MPLGERSVPLPPDNDGNEDVFTSQSTNCYPPRYEGGDDSPLPPTHPGAAVTAR